MSGQTPVLELRSISKSYGPVRALRSVSFAVKPAGVVGLIGDNGAGKSTLISIVSGSAIPDRGNNSLSMASNGNSIPPSTRATPASRRCSRRWRWRRRSTLSRTSISAASSYAPMCSAAGSNGSTTAPCGARSTLAFSASGCRCRRSRPRSPPYPAANGKRSLSPGRCCGAAGSFCSTSRPPRSASSRLRSC